ncbi:MAG: hypothetical protein ABR588_07930 [Sphingomicrobium sp.]|nr:hypothetical protein [Sphingomonadales bacterium]
MPTNLRIGLEISINVILLVTSTWLLWTLSNSALYWLWFAAWTNSWSAPLWFAVAFILLVLALFSMAAIPMGVRLLFDRLEDRLDPEIES